MNGKRQQPGPGPGRAAPLAAAAAAAACAACLLGAAAAPALEISNPALFRKSLAAAAQAVKQYRLLDDPEAQERVNRIGYQLACHADFDRYPFTFAVVDTSLPNAFALPAGQIFVTRGMLDLDLSDDMLAALLGHEIAHVTSEHFLKQKKRATRLNALSTLLSVGLIAASAAEQRDGYIGPYGYTRDQSSTEAAAQAALLGGMAITELVMRSYSREHEDESDEEGQRLAAAAGYDPQALGALMARMGERISQSKAYGYWQTHPFFDSREHAAEARGRYLATLKPKPAEQVDACRAETQAVLLEFGAREAEEAKETKKKSHGRPGPPDTPTDTEGPRGRPGPPDPSPDKERPRGRTQEPPAVSPDLELLNDMALLAWPSGAAAESLRLRKLHQLRDAELARLATSRDYGRIVAAYRRQLESVRSLTPDSPFLVVLGNDLGDLRRQSEELHDQSLRILERGVFETPFLEAFLSNYPDSPQAPRVALLLGISYSRLGRETDAVEHFLKAWESDPDDDIREDGDSPAAAAQRGLRNLAPVLTRLGSLQRLALQQRDPELGQRAEARLAKLVSDYDDITSGSEYLERFPDGPHAGQVEDQLNRLADVLYKEMLTYQELGDAAKAIARANQILTHAPHSPSARRISDEQISEQLDV